MVAGGGPIQPQEIAQIRFYASMEHKQAAILWPSFNGISQ